jgi:ectoine hydroxylase-related dioxygenase (phytanoyl-CoA dioxygenase family)
VLTAADVDALHRWGLDVEAWPVGSHVWGQYAEETSTGAKPCRTENVSACHDGVAGLVDGVIRDVAAEALGEAATAFKDKLNYKHPGGAGFSPHQDRLAYPGAQRVVSVLVAIDECTTESGCLWLADGIDVALPTDDRGVVRDDVVAALPWVAAELAPGDAVCLDGLTPHYSEANRGDGARRVLVASYAPTSEGYERSAYYEARQATMTSATTQDGRFRISTLADFEGTEVGGDTPASDRCTHPPAR